MSTIRSFTFIAGAKLAALFLSGAQSRAAQFQIGGTSVSDCTFWCTLRLQQVYDAALFPGPAEINRITFFASPVNGTAWDGVGTWQMSLSTSSNPVGSLSMTFADNVGADAAAFGSLNPPAGTLPAAAPVSFTGSFIYDPGMGDLLIDIERTAGTAVGVGMDAGLAAGQIDRAFSYDSTITALAANQNHYALRTEIEFTPVPEPAAATLLGLGAILVAVRKRRLRKTAYGPSVE